MAPTSVRGLQPPHSVQVRSCPFVSVRSVYSRNGGWQSRQRAPRAGLLVGITASGGFPRQRVASISARAPATSLRSSPFVSVRVRSGRLFAQRRLAVASACPFRVCWRCISGKKSVKSRKKVETRLEKFSVGDILDDVLRLMTPFLRSERFAGLIKVLKKIRRVRLTSLKTMIY